MFLLSSQSKVRFSATGGFGLIELMVSISIMAIIMAVVIARHDSFNGAVLLRSQAYEIALQLREVQLSAVSATNRGATEYRRSLGVYFNTSTPNQYIIFQDNNDNGLYDNGEQFGAGGVLDPRFEIRSIRYTNTLTSTVDNVSIIYQRPNFDAQFASSATSLASQPRVVIEIARVGTTGTGIGEARYVEVTQTGQISVKTWDEATTL